MKCFVILTVVLVACARASPAPCKSSGGGSPIGGIFGGGGSPLGGGGSPLGGGGSPLGGCGSPLGGIMGGGGPVGGVIGGGGPVGGFLGGGGPVGGIIGGGGPVGGIIGGGGPVGGIIGGGGPLGQLTSTSESLTSITTTSGVVSGFGGATSVLGGATGGLDILSNLGGIAPNLGDLTDGFTDTLDDFTETFGETVGDLTKTVGETAEGLLTTVGETAEGLLTTVQDGVNSVKLVLTELIATVQTSVKQATTQLEKQTTYLVKQSQEFFTRMFTEVQTVLVQSTQSLTKFNYQVKSTAQTTVDYAQAEVHKYFEILQPAVVSAAQHCGSQAVNMFQNFESTTTTLVQVFTQTTQTVQEQPQVYYRAFYNVMEEVRIVLERVTQLTYSASTQSREEVIESAYSFNLLTTHSISSLTEMSVSFNQYAAYAPLAVVEAYKQYISILNISVQKLTAHTETVNTYLQGPGGCSSGLFQNIGRIHQSIQQITYKYTESVSILYQSIGYSQPHIQHQPHIQPHYPQQPHIQHQPHIQPHYPQQHIQQQPHVQTYYPQQQVQQQPHIQTYYPQQQIQQQPHVQTYYPQQPQIQPVQTVQPVYHGGYPAVNSGSSSSSYATGNNAAGKYNHESGKSYSDIKTSSVQSNEFDKASGATQGSNAAAGQSHQSYVNGAPGYHGVYPAVNSGSSSSSHAAGSNAAGHYNKESGKNFSDVKSSSVQSNEYHKDNSAYQGGNAAAGESHQSYVNGAPGYHYGYPAGNSGSSGSSYVAGNNAAGHHTKESGKSFSDIKTSAVKGSEYNKEGSAYAANAAELSANSQQYVNTAPQYAYVV